MITSYKDLTIKEYLELKELMAEERADDLSAQVRLVAFLDKKTEEEIMSMKLPDYHKLVEKTKFLMELPEPSKKAPKSIKIGNYKLNVVTDIAKMTTAQYIDYQNFLAMEDKEKYIANIVGCFFVPQGKKYNVGYDIDEVVDLIANNVSIQDALDICFFFTQKWLSSIKDSLRYMEWKTKRMMRKKPEMKTELEEAMMKIHQYRTLLEGGTYSYWWMR